MLDLLYHKTNIRSTQAPKQLSQAVDLAQYAAEYHLAQADLAAADFEWQITCHEVALAELRRMELQIPTGATP